MKLFLEKKKCEIKKREDWIRPGRPQFLNDKVVADEWKCQSNRQSFRMSKQSFLVSCEELLQYISKNTTRFRKPIPVAMQVSFTIYYLSDEGRFRKTANAFGIAKNTVPMIIRRVTKAISNYLAYKYIKLLRTEEKVNESCSLVFEKHGFPQCLGGCRWDSHPDKATI